MVKKAKPGPKPMDPEDRRVQIPVRVKREIRQKLEQLAKQKKRSLSNIVEALLDRQLIDVDWRGDHHFWFGLLMGRIGWEVDQIMQLNPPFWAVDKGWLKHPFAAQYVRVAVAAVLEELGPRGSVGKIPDELRRTEKQLPPSFTQEQVDYFNSPEGLGRDLARDILQRLQYGSGFESDDFDEDYAEMPCVQDADLMPKIAKGLGLRKWERHGKKEGGK